MSSDTIETTDVIIIGAGLAGLVAGRDLTRAGVEVTILEGRDRVGGRAWYRNSPLGMDLEFGGGFVHWIQPHLWAEMNAYGLELKPVGWIDHAYWLSDTGVERMGIFDFLKEISPGEEAIAQGALEAFPNPHRPFPLTQAAKDADAISVVDKIAALGLSDREAAMIRSHWTLSFNGPPKDGAWSQVLRLVALAAGSWQMRGQAESRYMIEGGTSKLVDAIAADSSAQVRLSTIVTSVSHSADRVEVHMIDGTVIRAAKLIVTVPLATLNAITFDPPLSPVKIAAAERGQVSQGVKVGMRAKGKIETFIAFAPEECPLTMMGYEYEIDGDTILLGFGPSAADLDISDIKAVEAAARQWMPDIALVAVDGHDWTSDPLSRETWAMFGTNQLTDIEELIRPEGNIQIAGSDYALGWSGHFDGAIESGRRAARAILADQSG